MSRTMKFRAGAARYGLHVCRAVQITDKYDRPLCFLLKMTWWGWLLSLLGLWDSSGTFWFLRESAGGPWHGRRKQA